MASAEIKSKEKWDKAHKSLNRALEKEIALMREILANLHQEELSLLEVNGTRWGQVMEDRSNMVVQLGRVRTKRFSETSKLEKLAVQLERKEILPADEETSCEILTKLDQAMALLERINLQNCRNDALFDQTKQKSEIPLHCTYPHPIHQKQKRRPSVYTKNPQKG